MKILKTLIFSILILNTVTLASSAQAQAQAQEKIQKADPKQVLATINGQNITRADLEKLGGKQLVKKELELYDFQSSVLMQLLEQKLLEQEAAKQNTTLAALLKNKIESKVKQPSSEEIDAFYAKNARRFAKHKKEKVLPYIKNKLLSDQRQSLRAEYVEDLLEKANYQITLNRPHPIERATVKITSNDPTLGTPGAPIEIIEYTDYQCPFCVRARPTIKKVLEKYKGKVHYALKDFPLSFHKQAPKASEAAHCAKDQGKYWEYSDILWDKQSELDGASLKRHARALKLDLGKFNKCLSQGKYTSLIQSNLQEGQKAGVSGTPAFFINGRLLSGARPYAQFKRIIDEELRLKK